MTTAGRPKTASEHAGAPGGVKPGAPPESDAGLEARIGRSVARWRAGARLAGMEKAGGGASGRTFRVQTVDRGGEQLTVYAKAAPAGLEPRGNRDVVRQAQVLRTLADRTSIPVPRVLFVDPGDPPAIPPYYISAEIGGECWEPLTDDTSRLPAPDVVSSRVLQAARVLAALHAVDTSPFEAMGLGRVELGDEVGRWLRAYDRAGDAQLRELGHACADALRARVPKPAPHTLVHGDFRLGNHIYDAAGLRAVLDWEICSLSDPRVDLAWFLMTLSARTLPSAIRATVPGLPTAAEALESYRSASAIRQSTDDLAWFTALSEYRAAAAMALNVKHNRQSGTPSPRIERYAQLLPQFLEAARESLH